MEITVRVPEPIAKALKYSEAGLARRFLEALLVDECSRGHLSRGKVAELLGISFHEAEELFKSRGLPYPIKSFKDDLEANQPFEKK